MSGSSSQRPAATHARCAHEESYKGFHLASYVHRARLRTIFRALGRLDLPDKGVLGDFGCSNGYVLDEMRRERFPRGGWTFHGFDWNEELLRLARLRGIPDTTYHRFDLNEPNDDWTVRFDVVTMLETIEHVGNAACAVENAVSACRPGGYVLISAPNESGLAGLVKYFARRLVRRNPDGDFFEGKSRRAYLEALIRGGDLSAFRSPARRGWASHLGFDVRRFERELKGTVVAGGRCRLVRAERTGLGLGRLYVLRREIE